MHRTAQLLPVSARPEEGPGPPLAPAFRGARSLAGAKVLGARLACGIVRVCCVCRTPSVSSTSSQVVVTRQHICVYQVLPAERFWSPIARANFRTDTETESHCLATGSRSLPESSTQWHWHLESTLRLRAAGTGREFPRRRTAAFSRPTRGQESNGLTLSSALPSLGGGNSKLILHHVLIFACRFVKVNPTLNLYFYRRRLLHEIMPRKIDAAFSISPLAPRGSSSCRYYKILQFARLVRKLAGH
jgi:hypothetical protein